MQNGLPFDMQLPRYSPETLAAIQEVEDMKREPHKYKGFRSVNELFEELDSDDEI